MHHDERDIYNPYWWQSKLPQFNHEAKGAPLALTPAKAGQVLVNIVLGIHPRSAFTVAGLSGRTYDRYRKRSDYRRQSAGGTTALVKDTEESQADRYLEGYFRLEDLATEVANIQYSQAQAKLAAGVMTRHLTVKKVNLKKDVFTGLEVITLRNHGEVITEKYIEHPPKIPAHFSRPKRRFRI